MEEPEKGTKHLDVKHLTIQREQMAGENSDERKHDYSSDYYWIIDGYDSLYEIDYFDNYYYSDEGG